MSQANSSRTAEAFRLATPRGDLNGFVHSPEGPRRPRPTVVLCHGFKSFMEWGFWPPFVDLLLQRGFSVVRFNFTGAGMVPGDDLVTDLEAFRRATFSGDEADVLTVLQAIDEGTIGGGSHAESVVDPQQLALVGHSRGGGAVLLAASHESWSGRLRALVTWASVATFHRADAAAKAHWRQEGEVVIVNGRTGQKLPIGVEVLDDLEARAEDLDLMQAADRRQMPWLILHGTDDETVPLKEGQDLAAHAVQPFELQLIEGAGHTFGAQHPFVGPTPHLIALMNATQTWLLRHLR